MSGSKQTLIYTRRHARGRFRKPIYAALHGGLATLRQTPMVSRFMIVPFNLLGRYPFMSIQSAAAATTRVPKVIAEMNDTRI